MVVLLEDSPISTEELGSDHWVLPFKNDGVHGLLWDLQFCNYIYIYIYIYPSPDLCLDTIMSRRSTDNSFDFMAWFLLRHALSTVGPYIDRYVPFQIMSNQLNLPQVDSNQVVETF